MGFEKNLERPTKPRWLIPVTVGLIILGALFFVGAVFLVVWNIVDIGMHGVSPMNVTFSLLGCLLLLRMVTRK